RRRSCERACAIRGWAFRPQAGPPGGRHRRGCAERAVARIVVTGGGGFIGYHVSRALLARGDEVVIAAGFVDAPHPPAGKRRNARDLGAEFGRVRIVAACVTDRARVAPLLEGADAVLHLAGLAGVRPSFADPARYARINVEGTAVMQELTFERGIS